jgi:hypothetical protein
MSCCHSCSVLTACSRDLSVIFASDAALASYIVVVYAIRWRIASWLRV